MDAKSVGAEQLVAYALGELSVDDAARIAAAVAGDPAVAQLLATVRATLATLADAQAESPDWAVSARQKAALQELFAPRTSDWLQATADRVREWVAQRVATLAPGTPSALGFRSGAAANHLTYVCDDVEIDLRLRPADADVAPPAIEVLGMVTADDEPHAVIATRLADQATHELRLTMAGGFAGELPGGAYEFRIQFADRTIIVPRVELAGDPD